MADADRIERYEVRTHQEHGLRSEVTARSHRFFVDEPAEWGTDTAANPAELALAALGASLEVTTRMYAAEAGIDVTRLSTVLTSSLDLVAFLGERAGDDAGFGRVHVCVTVESTTTIGDARLRELQQAVERSCPMLGVFRSPTIVDLEFGVSTA